MRILAIETTGRFGSVAILEADDGSAALQRETRLDGGRTAQTLAPAIQNTLTKVGWPAGSIELVAVAVGPGSFTGLRIGVTTAKTLAYALGAQVMGVETMDVLAAQSPPGEGQLWTLMDAQRQELFVAKYSMEASDPIRQSETSIISRDEWLSGLRPGERVTGLPLARLQQHLPAGVIKLPESSWQPTASAVGLVGWREYQRGCRDDVWKLAPRYLRLSAAEEKALGKTRMTNDE
jgi:tRNA threonylcarbamoyladenosine biosynthesis protein TsaB